MVKVIKKNSILLLLSILLFGCNASTYTNLGHRAGGGCFKKLPENSLPSLRASLAENGKRPPLQKRKDFVYLEFDVRETADHELVVFHDNTLNRMMDRGALKLKVRKLTLKQLQNFRFKDLPDETIPTLEEFIDTCIDLKLSKPMVIEIKEIYSVEGKEKLLALCDYYRESLKGDREIIYENNFDFPKEPLILMGFSKNCTKTFGKGEKRKRWAEILKNHNIDGVYKPAFHTVNLMKTD